jgi:hypothetical protein
MTAPPLPTTLCAKASDASEPAALRRSDVGGENPCIRGRPRDLESHHADAAEADDHQAWGCAEIAARLAQGGIGGNARTHGETRERGVNTRGIDQIARMGNENVRGEAAIDGDAEMAGLVAEMLIAAPAGTAGAAADPGIDCVECRLIDRAGFGPGGDGVAGNLMAERERKAAQRTDIELFAVSQVEIPVLEMKVAVADAAIRDADEHLAALRNGQRRFGRGERCAVIDEGLAFHAGFPSMARAMRQKSATVRFSARKLASMPSPAKSVCGSAMMGLRLERSILRRWPKAAAVTFSSVSTAQGTGGTASGTIETIADVTLGCGVKARRSTSNRSFAVARHWQRTESRP